MANINLKHLRRVRAKGRTYFYHRRTGERLPDDETARIRRVLEINEGLEAPGRRVKVGSVEAIANLYRASPAFKGLSDQPRHHYSRYLKAITDRWGDLPIAGIQRKHIMALQDQFADKPATADFCITVLRVLLRFAVSRDYRTDNPAEGVPRLVKPSKVEGYRQWTDEEVAAFLQMHDATTMGLALKLALYTGQRRGDVLRMAWSDYDGVSIKVRQSKTGAKLEIACHTALRTALDAQVRVSPIILTTEKGRPFTGKNFRHH